MVTLYSKSKPPSKVDTNWIYWSNGDFEKINHESISALVVIDKKGGVNIIYKPTPVLNSSGKLEAIVGNIHDMKSSQSIFKIEGDEVGSCFAIDSMRPYLKIIALSFHSVLTPSRELVTKTQMTKWLSLLYRT